MPIDDQSPPRFQHGYLLEMPILLAVVGVCLSVLYPILSPTGRKILISISVLPVLIALFYMIVVPGWTPRDTRRIKQIARLLAFLLIAVLIVAVAAVFVLGA